MKNNCQCKRLISLILVLFMVIGLMPMHAHAAENGTPVDAAIIFSDLHTSSGDYKESTVKNIFGTLKNTGLPFSFVISAGDAFSVNADNTKYTGDPTRITGYIRTALGDNSMPVHYVWSDHDRYGTGISKDSGFVYGAGNDGIYGTADDGNYYVYSLSMADLSTNDRYNAGFHTEAQITATIAAFVSDAAKLDQSKPLFIASHQPLFDRRNDNGRALQWCTAINQVAANMDVAFFFGHNHRYDVAEDYFHAKGSTMAVTKPDYSAQNVTLNFTHMCAGYMAPDSTGSTSNTTRSGVVMAIVIYEDGIRYTTYNKSGVYTGNYAVNQLVPRDHAVTEPELVVSGTSSYFVGEELDLTVSCKTGSKVENVTAQAVLSGYDMNTAGNQTVTITYGGLSAEFAIRVREKVFRDAATGVSVEVQVPGATALTVNPASADSDVFLGASELLSSSAGYEIRLDNHAAGTEALVALPIPAGVTDCAVYRVGNDGTVTKMNITVSGGNALFTTDSFGAFLIGQVEISEPLENVLVAGGVSYEEKTVYVRVDTLENGGKYILVGENAPNGSPIAYLNNSGSEGWEVVSINTAAITADSTTYTKGYLELNNAGAVWTASGDSASGFTFTNGGRYIGGTDANTLKSSSSQAVKVKYDSGASRLKTASGTTRYLYYSTYNSENWKWSTSANSSTSSRNMWIYKEVKVLTAVSSPVTYTIQAQNLHHVLSSDTARLQFALLADGAAADLPSGAAYAFETVKDNSGIIAAISGDGVITFTNQVGSCYVKISCTWSEGTVYKYVKVTTEADPNACDHNYIPTATIPATCTEAGSVTYTCQCGDSYTEVIPALGHSYKATVTAPTCTDGGYTTYTCDCDDSYVSDYVNALPHSYKAVVTAPTCVEGGYTTYTCACGDTYVADYVDALGHSYESVTVEPTCTAAGSVTYTCHCGDTYTEVIPVLAHSYEAVVTAPTCTEGGYTTYTCACGDSYVADYVDALGHDYKSVTVEPTCTAAGSVTYTCHCGDTYTEVIPALAHSYEAVVTAPTCVEGGYTTYTCACGDTYVADEVAALGHTHEAVVTAPTCTEGGYTTYTCACGDSYVADYVDALGHDYESVTVAPTCTEGGYTGNTCTLCGDTTVTDETAALGHSHNAVVTAPTCETAGYTTYTCHCGDIYVADQVAALGHSLDSVVTAPTCETEGYTTHTCTVCGEVTVDSVVAALGHDLETVTVNASCTEAGSVTTTCVRCGESNVEVIAALGHDYTAVVTAPTCTEIGYTTYTCACGDSYVADETAALGHSYKSVTVNATCTEDGSVTYTCHCGESYTEVIATLGHDYASVVTAPTCTEAGYTTYTCHCGDTYIADEVAALGHDYESVTVNAACAENGSITYTCACGDTYAEVIVALGHSYEAKVTAPTCEQEGFTTYTCHCGDSYIADEVAALGHSYETQEQNGMLIHTCGACGHSYTESIGWIAVGTGYVLDTDGIDVGAEHKYIIVGADADYALTLSGSTVGAEKVTIRNNTLTVDDDSRLAFYFAKNNSEANTYLLTRDGSRSIYHVSGNINYGHDSKGYWYFGASSNGLYQLYDFDNCNWYLNYGYVWGNDSVSRFAVSSNARSVRLFKEADGYARLTGNLIQSVTDADNATVQSVLNQISIQLSANGSDITGTADVTADMLSWNVPFDGTTAGTYTAQVIYQGVELGTVTVNVTSKHTYVINVVAPTCTEGGYIERKCTTCGVSYKTDETAALGHRYTHADADGYRVYTCAGCGHSYSEKLVSTYSQVSAFTSGERFVITVKSGSKYYALSHQNNSISAVQVTVSGGKITSEITEDLLWSYEGGKLSYVSGGTTYYLYTYSSGWWWWGTPTLGISSGESGQIALSSSKLKIGDYYLRYSGSQFSANSSGTTIYLFQEN